jgi:DNA gyrase/topoisomerase IV subunit A
MDESQFLELSASFKKIRERLAQLPGLIDSSMADEMRLRRFADPNDSDLKTKIQSIKKLREDLQTEMIEKKALLPILRRQLVDASKKLCDVRVKDEANKVDELRENIKSTKLELIETIDYAIRLSAKLLGVDQMTECIMEHVSLRIAENKKHNHDLAKIGLETQMAEMAIRQKADQETLRKLMQFSALELDTESEKKKNDNISEIRRREEKIIGFVNNLIDSNESSK